MELHRHPFGCGCAQCACGKQEAPSRQVNILANQVLDSFPCGGQGLRAQLEAGSFRPGCSCSLLSGSPCGRVELEKPCLEQGPRGCHFSATLKIPYTIQLMVDGCREAVVALLCIPVSGVLRARCESVTEYIAGAHVQPLSIAWGPRCPELCFNFKAEIYAAALRVLSVDAASPKLSRDCEAFFAKPLYPAFPAGFEPYAPYQ
ncbi:MAG: hypothetical protein LBU47_00475 [Christensenellaceae bacterium]|jgi:hypothetical protein|nr:hypothetical protein [Christensenellaceae bacterium]